MVRNSARSASWTFCWSRVLRAEGLMLISTFLMVPVYIMRPPKEAPNVLLILLDDVGFGQFSVSEVVCLLPIWRSSPNRAFYTRFSG